MTEIPRASQRIIEALHAVGLEADVHQLASSTRTAADAASSLGCEVGAIASSLVFLADDGPVLVMTSGAHRVDLDLIADSLGLTGLRKATAAEVREATGQAIGGVAPLGHPTPLRTFVDLALAHHPVLWAAAGTPNSVFPLSYADLLRITAGTPVRVADDDLA